MMTVFKSPRTEIKAGPPVENPVEITITVSESQYNTLEAAANYYKWSIYDVIETLFDDAEQLVSLMEGKAQTGKYPWE